MTLPNADGQDVRLTMPSTGCPEASRSPLGATVLTLTVVSCLPAGLVGVVVVVSGVPISLCVCTVCEAVFTKKKNKLKRKKC